MHPILAAGLIPLAATAATALFAAKKEGNGASVLVQGHAPDGSPIVSIRHDVVSMLVQALGSFGGMFEGSRDGYMVLRIGPPSGDASAAQAALAAQAEGMVVLASTSLLDEAQSQEPGYLLFCDPSQRKMAAPDGKYAILLDVQHRPEVRVVPRVETPQFDAGIPANVLAAVNAALKDEASTAALRRKADILDAKKHTIAAKALRDRADALDLERALADEPEPVIAQAETEPDTAVVETVGEPAVEDATPAPVVAGAPDAQPEPVAVEPVTNAPHLNGSAQKPAFAPAVVVEEAPTA